MAIIILVGGFSLSKPFICLKDENIWPSAGLVCDNDHIPQFLVAGLFLNKLYYGFFKSKLKCDTN